jgi:hypothetical protein
VRRAVEGRRELGCGGEAELRGSVWARVRFLWVGERGEERSWGLRGGYWGRGWLEGGGL